MFACFSSCSLVFLLACFFFLACHLVCFFCGFNFLAKTISMFVRLLLPICTSIVRSDNSISLFFISSTSSSPFLVHAPVFVVTFWEARVLARAFALPVLSSLPCFFVRFGGKAPWGPEATRRYPRLQRLCSRLKAFALPSAVNYPGVLFALSAPSFGVFKARSAFALPVLSSPPCFFVSFGGNALCSRLKTFALPSAVNYPGVPFALPAPSFGVFKAECLCLAFLPCFFLRSGGKSPRGPEVTRRCSPLDVSPKPLGRISNGTASTEMFSAERSVDDDEVVGSPPPSPHKPKNVAVAKSPDPKLSQSWAKWGSIDKSMVLPEGKSRRR